jgi:hypothetical protein
MQPHIVVLSSSSLSCLCFKPMMPFGSINWWDSCACLMS